MASRIKGITVEIGGDTTGLDKALKGVNGSIRQTQTALRDVNRLLKLDPTNTQLLAQKQRVLKEAIDSTKDKLDALKQAQAQAKEQMERGELGRDKYEALEREIVATEQELKRLTEQAAECNAAFAKMDAVGAKMQSVGDSITGAGRALMPLSMVVGGLGVAAVKTTADFDASMSKVAAVSGATGDEFDALRDKAREMGSKTKFSASEAADAMNYMAMAGWKTEDMLSGIEGVMNLAAASGEDLATTSDIVTDALAAFGLTAADSGHFADILAAASSNANTNVSMMGETFKYCAPIAGALGFSAEDTAEAIGLMANAGIKSTQAGTALRTIMNNLSGDITISGAAIGDVAVATTNADGSMRDLRDILADCRTAFDGLSESEKAQAAEALVGKNAMSGFLALMNATPADIAKLEGAIDSCDGSAEQMAATMQDNLTGQITILKSQLQELAISIGDALMPVVRSVVSRVQEFVDKLNSMDDATRDTIIRVGVFVAALAPALVVIGTVVSKTGAAIQAISSMGKALAKLGMGAEGAGGLLGRLGAAVGGISAPVVVAVAAVGTLVAAFAHLWQTNEGFREAILATWERIAGAFQSFADGIVERLNALGFDFGSIAEAAGAAWEALCSLLAPLFEGAFSVVASVLEAVLGTLTGLLDVFIGIFTGNWSQAWEGVQGIFSSVWEGIKGMLTAAFEAIRDATDVVLGWFGTSWGELWEGARAVFEGAWNAIMGFLAAAWEAITSVVQTGVMLVGSILQAAFDIVTLPFRLIWENCKETVTAAWEAVKSVVGAALDAVSGTIGTAMSAISTTVASAWEAIRSRVEAVLGAVRGIVEAAFSAVRGAAESAWNAVRDTVGAAVEAVRSRVTAVFEGVRSTLSGIFESIRSVASSVWNGIRDAIVAPIEAARERIRGIIDAISGFFSGLHLELPHIKLPHFSIQGDFSLAPPSVPHLAIDWYREGGIMTRPTVFGMNGSSLMAGGEAGAEVILPLKGFYDQLGRMLERGTGGTEAMERYLAVIAANSAKDIVLDSGVLVGELAPGVNRRLGNQRFKAERGMV